MECSQKEARPYFIVLTTIIDTHFPLIVDTVLLLLHNSENTTTRTTRTTRTILVFVKSYKVMLSSTLHWLSMMCHVISSLIKEEYCSKVLTFYRFKCGLLYYIINKQSSTKPTTLILHLTRTWWMIAIPTFQ